MNDQNQVTQYAISGLADVLTCLGLGIPTAIAETVYKDILAERAKNAFEILMSEIRNGNFDNLDQYEVVSVCARYQRDAMEGVARNNLRLLARLIKGMAYKEELKAPAFSRYANILSSLTEKEMRILAIMAQYKNNNKDARHKNLMTVTKQAEGHLQALMRTGLINMRMHTPDDLSEGTHSYHTTKLMDEIVEYTDNFPDTDDEL